ncbi:unnamed protein product [Vitrella brassicaformis CCMP3155]|uniref:Uncharacterized protein n=1 Tax=Vitrella brassicaformis (strain CCMP3155) TaxID=1169540 RepID=A0A0G4FYX6_VITBC|nr:unnamed protein product [Vitrella brassicaformis CCMP3155]|eukprot:CEM20821.1 unnamed protein product [Vitrella brassicaformis CCMP3155]
MRYKERLAHHAGFVFDDISLYGMDVLEYDVLMKEKKVPTEDWGAFIPGGLPVFVILLAVCGTWQRP